MTNAEILGNKLYELRKGLGISQEELADKLNVSRQAISKWERGESLPDTDNLISLAKLYGVSLDELVGLTTSSKDSSTDKTTKFNFNVNTEKDNVNVNIECDGISFINDEDEEDNDDNDNIKIKIGSKKFSLGGKGDKNKDSDIIFSQDGKPTTQKSKFLRFLNSLPYPILITVAYLLWGSLTDRGWAIGWTLYLTIPVYYSIIKCFKTKQFKHFAYPCFATFLFCLVGMAWGIWHPTWVIFITIPIFESIISAFTNQNDSL